MFSTENGIMWLCIMQSTANSTIDSQRNNNFFLKLYVFKSFTLSVIKVVISSSRRPLSPPLIIAAALMLWVSGTGNWQRNVFNLLDTLSIPVMMINMNKEMLDCLRWSSHSKKNRYGDNVTKSSESLVRSRAGRLWGTHSHTHRDTPCNCYYFSLSGRVTPQAYLPFTVFGNNTLN